LRVWKDKARRAELYARLITLGKSGRRIMTRLDERVPRVKALLWTLVLSLASLVLSPPAYARHNREHLSSVVQKKVAQGKKANKSIPKCTEMSEGIQTDLAGSYPGTVEFQQMGLSGDVLLVVEAQQEIDQLKFNPFSLTATGNASLRINGRLIAVTTCGYTTVTMVILAPTTDTNAGSARHSTILSLRACKSGTALRLFNATTSTARPTFSFSSTPGSIKDNGRWGRCNI